ncbi:MAG: metallophosphoesterase [Halopseudomonas sp.]
MIDPIETLAVDPSRPCKLIQISDLHLPALRQQRYRDRDVEQQLITVLQHIGQHHADLDALLLTGDLVHHGHADSYRRLAGYLESLGKPWYWIAGNHDSLVDMQRVRPDHPHVLCCNGWRILLLDSTSAGDGLGSGSLADSELQRLQYQLQAAQQTGESLLLVLHHNPLPLQSAWQDAIMLANAEHFWELLERFSLPITVLYGHVHQVWQQFHNNVSLLSCPATSVQFARGQQQLMIETEGEDALPGYRWLTLSPGAALDQTNTIHAGLETGIARVSLA